MSNLNILAVQPDLVWENSTQNLRHLDHLLEGHDGADLMVLPEMFATGFTMRPELHAQSMKGEAVSWMLEVSKSRAVCGSLAIKDGDNYYNRFIWAEDGKIRAHYDKKHLFSFGNEPKHYTPGNQRIVLNYKGVNVLPFVCYDLRFPVWCRNVEKADIMLFVANWPQVRIHAWDTLLQARAIENQCYVLGVNRVGEDGNNVYHNGNSACIGFKGDVLWKSENAEAAKLLQLDIQILNDYRSQFPVLADMDSFQIE